MEARAFSGRAKERASNIYSINICWVNKCMDEWMDGMFDEHDYMTHFRKTSCKQC